MRYALSRASILLVLAGFSIVSIVSSGRAEAVSFQLTWVDNSQDESGFHIERKLGTNGVFSVVASVGADVTSYSDSNLADGTTYCYRARAYNSAGNSPYSDEICGTTPASSTTPPPAQQFTLDVNVVKTVSSGGTGNGTVTSSPAGINCGSTCSALYNSGTVVSLTATPAPGSTFAGWSGTGCGSGAVTMNASKSCTATFNPHASQMIALSVGKAGSGSGTITSNPSGINCGSNCSAAYNSGAVVTLVAKPGPGSIFAGWSGTGCTNDGVTMNTNRSCTATFQSLGNQLTTKIGVFRPDTGEWFLDHTGNGQWDDGADIYISSSGQSDDLPVVGSWSGNGVSNIGIFNPGTGTWQLDTNGDGVLDCAVDTCISSFGQAGDLPVIRDLNGVNGSIIGTFTPQSITIVSRKKRIKRGLWNFDLNENCTLDGCDVDECDTFGTVGELPVIGDWNGSGTEQIGIFLPKKGSWHLDLNGDGTWNGCRVDKCLGPFGTKEDLPVVGDWDGTGTVRIGVFRPSTAMWYLDLNGNGKLDNCSVDACLGPFGQPGDLPVVGKW